VLRKSLILMALLGVTGSVSAQEQRYKLKDKKYIVEGEHLPKYLLVQVFFERAYRRYQGSKSEYDSFLRELQISPGTPSAQYFSTAMLEAHDVSVEVLDMMPHVKASPAEWDELQQNFLRKQVSSLKRIYGTLRNQFKHAESSFGGVDKYIEEKVRPSMKLASEPDPPIKTLEIMDSFDKEEVNQN
jgi:hypothetical protein